MKKGKRIKSADGEIPLPEAMIQRIQSFLSRKEAARTTILSQSWYNAWLTRPDFDTRDFHLHCPESKHMFEEFVTKTIQRYQNLSLKIDSFRLRSCGRYEWHRDLMVDAMKMGPTAFQLENFPFTLPQEVLGSKTLLKLCLRWCKVEGNYAISCSRLKSLTLDNVKISDDVFKDLISSCISMEKLSLSSSYGRPLKWMNPFELHKLRRLFLDGVGVGSIFSSSFSSRFPCLRDLHILQCDGFTNIQIASAALETICLKTAGIWNWKGAKFDVPNIRKFTYSCPGLPSHLSINVPSRQWEFDISIFSNRFHKMSWFANLKRLLKKFWLSRISLLIKLDVADRDHEVDVEVVRKPLVVENLMIHLLVRSLGALRPKFITHGSVSYTSSTRVIEQLFVSNWQERFGQCGLKKVNVEICEEFDTEWRPLELKKHMADAKAKARLQLIWED